MFVDTMRAYMLDMLHIILSPEYGAEALKVLGAYLLFRTDIKKLGVEVKNLAKAFGEYVTSNNTRVTKIETHLGLNNSPERAEGAT